MVLLGRAEKNWGVRAAHRRPRPDLFAVMPAVNLVIGPEKSVPGIPAHANQGVATADCQRCDEDEEVFHAKPG